MKFLEGNAAVSFLKPPPPKGIEFMPATEIMENIYRHLTYAGVLAYSCLYGKFITKFCVLKYYAKDVFVRLYNIERENSPLILVRNEFQTKKLSH